MSLFGKRPASVGGASAPVYTEAPVKEEVVEEVSELTNSRVLELETYDPDEDRIPSQVAQFTIGEDPDDEETLAILVFGDKESLEDEDKMLNVLHIAAYYYGYRVVPIER